MSDKEVDQARDDLNFVLRNPAARRVLWRIMDRCGIYSACFTTNSQTFYEEGKRSVGLSIVGDLVALSPDAYPNLLMTMHRERLANERSNSDESDT